jgi:signal transduction histidine kinase
MRRRGAKPARAKGQSKPPAARKSRKGEGSRARDLEKRLAEALEQQTATSEILRVISSSPSDVQPVFNTVVQSALRLLGGYSATMMLLRDDDRLDLVAYTSTSAEADASLIHAFPMPLRRIPAGERAVHERRAHAVEDVESAPDATDVMRETGRARGWRSNLFVPMIRDDVAVGLISITRREPGPFAADQIALLEIFAAQAVIAIENVRLFKDLQARNRELTEAVEQQTATAEILNVISRSPTNVQPVFEAILESAVRLCETAFGAIFRFDGERLHLVGHHGIPPGGVEAYRQAYPMAPKPEMHISRAIRERRVVYVPDILAEPQITYTGSAQQAIGYRSLLMVPMLRDGQPVGVVGVGDREPGGLSDKHVALVRTFADQAVIAIENVRLFNELESANRELEAASRHKSEFLANMSHELRTPLNAVIGFSEVLLQRMFGELNAKQEEYLQDIYVSGQHLLSLINDILDLSKIEAGRMELELVDFDLPTAIESALILVRERAGRRGIALHQAVDLPLGPIRGDERKIKQVLLNILSNALKFTPEGGRIDVRARVADGMAEISVADTGVGIAPEDQEAIFEEFRQVGTAAKKVEGTGLGLALSRKFIALHGGRIWVQSQVGIGSTFTFTIPVIA